MTTRRLKAGFLPLSDVDVAAIEDANGYTALRPAFRAVEARFSRFYEARFSRFYSWPSERGAALEALQAQITGIPVDVSCLSPEAPLTSPAAPDPLPGGAPPSRRPCPQGLLQ